MSWESGEPEIYVRDLEGGGRRVVSIDGGVHPAWSPDGATLYYVDDQREPTLMRAPVTYDPALRFGTPVAMFPMTATAGFLRNRFALSADGQRFLIMTDRLEGGSAGDENLERGRMHVLLNWGQVLRDRVKAR